jgi:glyoxylase-like metal-dependent hydrolase (beta-lactamase superfamily II)
LGSARSLAVLMSLIALQALIHSCGLAPGNQEETANTPLIQNRGEGLDNWYDSLPRPAWSKFRRVETSQDWFEVYEVLPSVFGIYEPGQFEEVISYLIVGSERALLFDTGLGIGDMKQTVSELTNLHLIVLNSHTHYDHIGGNDQFEMILGTDTAYARENARGKTHDEVSEFVGEGWIWKPTPDGFSPETYQISGFSVSSTVNDGDEIDLGDRTLEVLFTPGHSPDSLCLIDRANRLLFTGDTFYPAPLYTHLHGSDFEAYGRTANRLAELISEVDYLLPAHNEPLMPNIYLERMRNAFESITAEVASYSKADGNREYQFEGFSILTKDPP